jgi:hypothetical protein
MCYILTEFSIPMNLVRLIKFVWIKSIVSPGRETFV